MDEKSLLIWIRYVKICCRIKLFLCCRISFLIIVLPDYLFLYIYFKFFAHRSGISRKEISCGRCPHPASGIRLGFSGNTANANEIRPGHLLDKAWCPGFPFFTGTGEAFPHKGRSSGLTPGPSSYSVASIFWPRSRWQDKAFFPGNCRLGIHFWSWSLSGIGG